MTDNNALQFDLHDRQFEVFNDPARFKVVAAGRRFGKSYLAKVMLLIEGMKMENEYGYDLKNRAIYYIAPTFEQAKRIMWQELKDMGRSVIDSTLENQGIIKLINGREIHLKGADRPDTLRGVGLSYVVLDEYAFMKPDVWEYIIRPTLADCKGSAMFIGTPEGKNHFYDLYEEVRKHKIQADKAGETPEWACFSFSSSENTFIPIEEEIQRSIDQGTPAEVIRQEYFASFQASGGKIFKEDNFKYLEEEPKEGVYYIAVDPAGYEEVSKKGARNERLDEMAIAIVKVGSFGWYVAEIRTGRWNVREASIQVLKAAKDYQAMTVGIEKGALKNAIMPYLSDQMRRLSIFPHITDVTHGGKKKTERIAWALQGRLEHGRLFFPSDTSDCIDPRWVKKFINQALDFPNPLSHDDMLDALAYVDQVATTSYFSDDDFNEQWEPLDDVAGY